MAYRKLAGMRECACGCKGIALDNQPYINKHDFTYKDEAKHPGKVRYVVESRGHDTPCWTWQLSTNSAGYGQIGGGLTSTERLAHRWYYQFHKGRIPGGLVLDHLCNNRNCVNPDHLEPVTFMENIRRAPKTGRPRWITPSVGLAMWIAENSTSLSRSQIADMLGVSRASITRTLGSWSGA